MGRHKLQTMSTAECTDQIPRPIVVPFIRQHHLMLKHDNAELHVARICTQFLEAENIPVLAQPACSPDMSPIEHVWDALDQRVRQRVPIPANIQQLHTAIEEEWADIPQAKINNNNLCKGDVSHCMRQMVITPDTDISDPLVVVIGIRDQKMQICSPSHVKSIVQCLINVCTKNYTFYTF